VSSPVTTAATRIRLDLTGTPDNSNLLVAEELIRRFQRADEIRESTTSVELLSEPTAGTVLRESLAGNNRFSFLRVVLPDAARYCGNRGYAYSNLICRRVTRSDGISHIYLFFW